MESAPELSEHGLLEDPTGRDAPRLAKYDTTSYV